MFGMPKRCIAVRSIVMPNAKPCQRFESMPQFSNTPGWIIPQPPHSSQPPCHEKSNSADGSVNGKKCARKRSRTSAPIR